MKDAALNTDSYIDSAPAFAQPVLSHVRHLIHQACPGVTETIKWGCPSFEHKGWFCTIAAFKQHCAVNFPKESIMADPHGVLKAGAESKSAGSIGRITSLADLPSDKIMLALIKEAVRLNEVGSKAPAKVKAAVAPKAPVAVPGDLQEALQQNTAANITWEAFPPSHRKEYIEWITGAQKQETRDRRISATIEKLAAGGSLNEKYK